MGKVRRHGMKKARPVIDQGSQMEAGLSVLGVKVQHHREHSVSTVLSVSRKKRGAAIAQTLLTSPDESEPQHRKLTM